MRDLTSVTSSDPTATDPAAFDELIVTLYDELRRMARGYLRGEGATQTLDTTALVHEAYLRLADHKVVSERGRAYFFGAAAKAMRRILVERARSRSRIKRGGSAQRVSLTVVDLPDSDSQELSSADLLAIDAALDRLAEKYPRQAGVVECRFFGGLSVEETALALESSQRPVKRDWAMARAWLFRELTGNPL